MTVYYNEFDPVAAQWLRNLIAAGHIAPGDVDERSISDVRPSDLAGYTQCHFFAGIGVWSYALRQSGWPDDQPVWTGSCPCQPFSAAGKGDGFADERHLWPHWHWLIRECGPPVIFGEQVAAKGADPWVDLVQADLEALDYAFGCVPFPAAGIGAPHIRDRNYWVADAAGERRERRGTGEAGAESCAVERSERLRDADRLDHPDHARLEGQRRGHHAEVGHGEAALRPVAEAGEFDRLADPHGRDAEAEGLQRGGQHGLLAQDGSAVREGGSRIGHNGGPELDRPSPTNGHWRDADWLLCRDGKWRPVEPGTFPLAHGAASRVGRLRAYGNAIVAQAAQAFIEAYLEHERDTLVGSNRGMIGHNNGPALDDFEALLA